VAHAEDETDGDVWIYVTVQQASGDAQMCQLATLQSGSGCAPGVYRLVYRVRDAAGNQAVDTLTVCVRGSGLRLRQGLGGRTSSRCMRVGSSRRPHGGVMRSMSSFKRPSLGLAVVVLSPSSQWV